MPPATPGTGRTAANFSLPVEEANVAAVDKDVGNAGGETEASNWPRGKVAERVTEVSRVEEDNEVGI